MAVKSVIVNTEELNRRGYRILTAGIDLRNFKKNPVMFFNHHRTWRGEEGEMLPIGYWENLRVENGVLLADPVFDEDDEFALKIKKKYDKGVLRAASIGIVPIVLSDDPKHLLPGQTRPTVVKSELREISIVDIPGNPGAVVLSSEGKILELSDNAESPLPLINPKKFMDDLRLISMELQLKADSEVPAVVEAVKKLKADLSAEQQKCEKLSRENQELKDAQENADKKRNEELVDSAITHGKIKKTEREDYLSLASANFDAVKRMLDGMKAQKTLKEQTEQSAGNQEKAMSFTDMSKKNPEELLRLKNEEPEEYKRLFSEEFGHDPKGV